MRKMWVVLLFISILIAIKGSDNKPIDYEEGIIYLRLNGELGDTFFPALLRGDNREVYISIKEMLEVGGIISLEYDEKEGKVEGSLFFQDTFSSEIENKTFEGSFQGTKTIEKDGEVYVEAESISRIFPVDHIVWEREKLFLDINFDFLLPIEVEEIQEGKRAKLAGEGKEVGAGFRNDREIFSPGVVQVRYYATDFKDREEDDTLEVNYYNQLLYGNFTFQTDIKPEVKKRYVALKYDDLIEDMEVTIGDISLERDSMFSVGDSNLKGVSITNDSIFIREDTRSATIEGQVLNGTTVELYQSGVLVDYQIVNTGNRYIFSDVSIIGFSDEYTLKFYYPDGRYEERKITLLDNWELQGRGESNYYLQVGESEDELTVSTRYLYGVTNNLTLGAGYLRAKSRDYIDNEDFTFSTIETDIIYNRSAKKNSTLYNFKFFTDLNDKESEEAPEYNKDSDLSFKGNIYKTMFDYDIRLFLEEYSKTIANGEEEDRRYGATFSNSNAKIPYTLSAERTEEFQGDEDEYGLELRYTINNRWRLNLKNDYYHYSDSRDNRFRSDFDIGYSGFEKFDINLMIATEIENGDNSEEYEVRINKKNRYIGKGDLDYYADIGYRDDEWYFRIGVQYYFTDWLSTHSRFTDEDQEYGMEIDKTIILSKPFEKNINPNPENSWVEGRVFRDENGNGVYDEGEEIYEGIGILSTDRNEVFTNSEGYFLLTDIPSNELYELRIDTRTIDPMFKPVEEKYSLMLIPSTGYYQDIALVPVSAVMGNVNFKNGDELTEREKILAYQQVKIYLKKDNEIVMGNSAEMDGFFILDDVMPGRYQLEVRYLGNRGYRVSEEKYDVTIGTNGEFIDGFEFWIMPDMEEGRSTTPTQQS